MTCAQKEKVRALTLAGKRQSEIAVALSLHRNSIYRAQKSLGLHACQGISDAQEKQVLGLLRSGRGTSWIGKTLGVGEHQARLVATKFNFRRKRGEVGYRYHLSEQVLAKILEEIREHRNFARQIAWKYHVAYKIVLALARKELGCERFRSGYGTPALSSHFPQKNHDRRMGNDAAAL
jgi:DNA-binding CsgD family transcriptional regulator